MSNPSKYKTYIAKLAMPAMSMACLADSLSGTIHCTTKFSVVGH